MNNKIKNCISCFCFVAGLLLASCLTSCGNKAKNADDEAITSESESTYVVSDLEEPDEAVDSDFDPAAEEMEEEASSDDSCSSSSSSSSEDWDAVLDAYDSYVTKYISYVKRAANGDMGALAEYPALMEKAEEFSNKMENAQGDMTSSQWARYMRITNKMSQAALEM